MRSYVVAAFVFSLLAGTPVLAGIPGVKFINCELAPAEAAKGACHIPYDKAFSSAEADDGLSTSDTATATDTVSTTSTMTATTSDGNLKLARRSQAVGDNLNTDKAALAHRPTSTLTGTSPTFPSMIKKHKHAEAATTIKRNLATATTLTPAAATVNAKRIVSDGAPGLPTPGGSSSGSSSAASSTSSAGVSSATVSSTSSANVPSAPTPPIAPPVAPPMLPQGNKRSPDSSDSDSDSDSDSTTSQSFPAGITQVPDMLTDTILGQTFLTSINGVTAFFNLYEGQQSTTTVYDSGAQPTATSSGSDNNGGHMLEIDLFNSGSVTTSSSDASGTDAD